MGAAELAGAKRVLVVRLGKLGDLMAGLWLLRQLRQARPGLRIDMLALPRVSELLSAAPWADEVAYWQPWAAPYQLLKLRSRRYDLLLDLNDAASGTSAFISRAVGARHSMAFKNARSEAAFSEVVAAPASDQSHVMDRLGCMAKALGLAWRPADLRPQCPLPDAVAAQAAQALRQAAGPGKVVVALNLSAGHASRYWAPQKWNALAAALLKASPRVRLLWLHLPSDAPLKAQASAGLPAARQLPLAGGGFLGFCASIKASQMLVSPDTSAVHAASAFGVPVLALYPEAAWNFRSWAPIGTRHRALRSPQGGVDAIPLAHARQAALELLKPLLRSR